MTRAKWLGLVFSGIVLAGMTAWAFHPTLDVRVESLQVTRGAITRRVVTSGTVQPVTTADVGTQVSGNVQSLEADFNSLVTKGQVIARIDPTVFQEQLAQAQANLSSAKAQLDGDLGTLAFQKVELQRNSDLVGRGLITQDALDEVTTTVGQWEGTVAVDQAQIEQAQAQVDQAQANLDHTVITSPIDGIVLARNVDIGQTLAAAVQAPVLFSIASDLTHVQVQVDIDESDVDGLTTGELATFEVESYPDETFSGTLTQLRVQPVTEQTTTVTTVATSGAPSASSAVATVVSYTAIIDVANPDEKLRPGMTAEVALDGSRRENVARIPNSALAFHPPVEVLQALRETEPSVSDAETGADAGGQRSLKVWTYDGKHLTPIAVHVGLADSQWTELVSGLIRPGDMLVTRAAVEQKSRF